MDGIRIHHTQSLKFTAPEVGVPYLSMPRFKGVFFRQLWVPFCVCGVHRHISPHSTRSDAVFSAHVATYIRIAQSLSLSLYMY